MVDGKHLRGSGKGKSSQVRRVEVLALHFQTTWVQVKVDKSFAPPLSRPPNLLAIRRCGRKLGNRALLQIPFQSSRHA